LKNPSKNAYGASLGTHLHTTNFPTGVATNKPTSKGLITSLDNFTNLLDTREWVAPESKKKNDGLNSRIGLVLVTTFDSTPGSLGTSE